MQYQISDEMISKLNLIYTYFGGRENKLQKLFQESSEFRDAYILSEMSILLKGNLLTEICDLCSCCFQLYFNEEKVRNGVDFVINKTIKKIEDNYYIDKEL